MVKNPLAVQETGVQSLGQEDPMEKGMATHSNILAWRIPWIEEPGRLQSMGLQRVRHNLQIGSQLTCGYVMTHRFKLAELSIEKQCYVVTEI